MALGRTLKHEGPAFAEYNYRMFDKHGIYQRVSECHATKTPYELAMKLGIDHSIAYQWYEGRRPIPWPRLKLLVDEQGLSWDWLIEGREPKHSRGDGKNKPLSRHAINQRFLSLFPKMSQAQIGKELGVNPGTIFKWRHDISQVPWERLKYAVDNKGVTWEWLLEER